MPNLNYIVSANVTNAQQAFSALSQRLAQSALDASKMSGALDSVGAALIPLQNNLRNFESALKKATDPNEVQYLTRNINILRESIDRVKNTNTGFVKGANEATNALGNLSRVVQDAPFGFIGIANNINPLLESFQRLKLETGSNIGALKALGSSFMGAGGLGLAVGAATALLTVFGDKLFKVSETAQDTADAAKKASDAIKSIFDDTAKEATQIQSLIIVLQSETATRERKADALKELQKLQPQVFEGLKLEGNTVTGLTTAYNKYLESLRTIIAARIKQQQLEQVTSQILQKQGVTLTGYAKVANDLGKLLSDNQKRLDSLANKPAGETKTAYDKQQKQNATDLNLLYKQQGDLIKELGELQTGIKIDTEKPKKVREEVDKVEEVLRKLRIDQEELAKNPLISIDDKDTRNFDLLTSAIERLRDLKLGNNNAIILKLRAEIDETASQIAINKFHDRLEKTGVGGVEGIPVPISFRLRKDSGLAELVEKNLAALDKLKLPRNLQDKVSKFIFDPEKFKDATERATSYMKDTASFAQKTLDPIFSAVFDNIGKGSQTALQAVGDAVKGLVTQLIRAAAEAAVLSLILNAIFPGSSGKFSFTSMFSSLSGLPKFAEGGLAYGPTVGIFGEYADAGNNPEVVAPLSKLQKMIGNSGSSHVVVTGQISGNNIHLANARQNNTRRRLYGK